MARDYALLENGTPDSLLESSQFISTIKNRQDLKVAFPEEVAYRQGWINAEQLELLAKPLLKNEYGKYIIKILSD